MNLASLQGLYYEAGHRSWLASTTHNMTRTDGSGDDFILHPNPNTDHNQRAAKNNSQHKSSVWRANKNGASNNADSQHHHCLHPRQHDPSQPRVGWTMMMSKTSRTMRSWMPAVEQKAAQSHTGPTSRLLGPPHIATVVPQQRFYRAVIPKPYCMLREGEKARPLTYDSIAANSFSRNLQMAQTCR